MIFVVKYGLWNNSCYEISFAANKLTVVVVERNFVVGLNAVFERFFGCECVTHFAHSVLVFCPSFVLVFFTSVFVLNS